MKIHHHIKHAFSTPDYLRILILRTIGNFLILGSLIMIGKTLYNPIRQEIVYFINTKTEKEFIISPSSLLTKPVNTQPKNLMAKLLNVKPIEILTPEDPNFSVVIPKIGANARVLPNIDASDEKIYLEALKKGVAHTGGTAFPGEGGHIFLFAHSTDYFWNVGNYNAVFYLLYKLEQGDEVDLYFQGQRYVYQVVGKQIVDPSQVEYITRKTNKEFITLQTCWPLGTTLQRLLVFASRKVE